MTPLDVILLILLILGIQAGVGLVMERRSPTSTLAWLLILILVPVVGVPLYILLGRVHVRRKIQLGARASRRLEESMQTLRYPVHLGDRHAELSDRERPVSDLIVGLGGAPARAGNCVTVLQDGADTFAAMEAAIREARHYVHFVFFIFNPGEVGERMRDALADAAGRGVEVCMLFDAVGSRRLTRPFLQPILDRGGRYADFGPVRFSRYRRRPDFRNHRKILVADGRVGFVGGLNVMDEYVAAGPGTPWRDTHVRVEGPVVHDLEYVLMESWYVARDEMLAGPDHFPDPGAPGNVTAQVIPGGPSDAWPSIEKAYVTALQAAREKLCIVTPYFVPTDAVMDGLTSASLRGVDVRLMVPMRGDHVLVDWAGHSYHRELLEAGVRVFRYGPRMVHGKTLTVDGRFCIIGTANLDIRSFRLNYEVGTFVFDPAVTAGLDRDFENDLEASREIDLERFLERPLAHRFRDNTARLLSPLL